MARTYLVVCESRGILNPGERGFRSLDKARDLCAREREACSWECLTPPGYDNPEGGPTSGKFRCGVLSPHGISVQISVNGRIIEPSVQDEGLDPKPEDFRRCKGAGKRVDWTLEAVIDRGTDYLADGADTFYFTGPEQTDSGWDAVLEAVADGDEVVEATVRPTPFGRYSHLIGDGSDYPMQWVKGRGF